MSSVQRAREVADESAGKGDLQSCLATARRQVYLDGVARRQEDAIQLEALQTYACGRGKDELDKLFSALPSLQPLVQDSLEAVPSSEGLKFWLPAVGSGALLKALSYCTKSRLSNIPQALQQEWAEHHTTILEESCPPLLVDGVGVTKCQKLGYCICGATAKAVLQLRNQLLSAMKKQFGGKERKQKLAKADIVFMLKTSASCTHQIEASMSELRWCHIAAMSFSPYQPTIHCLQHCPEEDDDCGLEQRCVLKVPISTSPRKICCTSSKTLGVV
eukprot:6479288-Amphidinium_carterae.3